MRNLTATVAVVLWPLFFLQAGELVIPHPLPSHPGNIFVAGEHVTLPAPRADATKWKAVDYDGKTVAEVTVKDGKLEFGALPVGYYEANCGEGFSNRVSFGVLAPLQAPTPLTSPIGIDVAMAWFFSKEKMPDVVSLCQLAGMNRVRDRFFWGEMEPTKGCIVTNETRNDISLTTQSALGLQVLDVNHASPVWANPNGKRFPLDLRDIHYAYRELAKRWKGKIVAFEPWNEADIDMFGGHTGDEMASLQKAAYLGIKAGDPDLTVCMNVFAIRRQTTLRNFDDNKAAAYFDTFNLHHYEPFENYPSLYADFRAVSAGKPMWTTECSVTVHWSGDEKLQEPTPEDTRVQSERVARTYASAIYEGSKAVFFFMLPHYVERDIQYGLLHRDLTPRPGYLAAAAVGRFLADAQPIGRIETNKNGADGYLFRAKPDGKEADVLVIWGEHDSAFELPAAPASCFDHLGRKCNTKVTGKVLHIGRGPIFALLSKGGRPGIVPPPAPAQLVEGKPGSIVLQALPAEKDVVLKKSAYQIPAEQTSAVPIFIYNFGNKPAHGNLSVMLQKQWSAEFPHEVDLAPGERKELTLKLSSPKAWSQTARVKVRGEFGEAGDTLLAMRFAATEK